MHTHKIINSYLLKVDGIFLNIAILVALHTTQNYLSVYTYYLTCPIMDKVIYGLQSIVH